MTRLYVGTKKGLFRFDRANDGAWNVAETAFLGDPVPMLLPRRDGRTVHAALQHGHFGAKMHVSHDGGASFDEGTTPAYPEKPEGFEDLCPMRKIERPWSLELTWALEEGTPDQEGRLWCGTIPGGLFRSDDGGGSWTLVRSLWDRPERTQHWMGGGYDFPGIHSVLVDPRDGRHVVVGVSCGGAWRTRDDGATWKQTAHGMRSDYAPDAEAARFPESQDPHRIAACTASPDVLWCQHHNGIFRSTDAGASWTEIEGVEPSAFGFAVAAHPSDPRTAWFVPAIKDERRIPVDGRVVVTRTRDGGQSFETLRAGLPQDHAYDLVYRHALDVDGAGDTLALGSTTGNLWVSEDGGDRFETVSNSLPPILCVRFGPALDPADTN
ncbi:MAG: exo-alpha-sialidase [Planctomycetota bacterium]